MFIGHYGPALALQAAAPKVKLWHLFVAVQLLDYGWAAFILTGIEQARIVPDFLAASDLDLFHMPYTHSLLGAAGWSLGAAIVYGLLVNRAAGPRGALIIGAAVFSHWLADLLVHTHDLALYPGSPEKMGLGLWASLPLSQSLEAAVFTLGVVVYARMTTPVSHWGRAAPWVMLAVFFALQVYNLIGPAPEDIRAFAATALAAYTALAALAFAVERGRAPRNRAEPA